MARSTEAARLIAPLGGRFTALRAAGEGASLTVGDRVTLAPGEGRAFAAAAAAAAAPSRTLDPAAAREAAVPQLRLAIEAVTPSVDGGACAV